MSRLHVGVFTVRDLTLDGGSLIRIVGTTRHLRELGVDVTLFAPNLPARLRNAVDHVPLSGLTSRAALSAVHAAFPVALAPTRLMRADRALADLIVQSGVQVIHAHQHPGGFRLLKLRARLPQPILLDVHGIFRLQRDDHLSGRRRLTLASLLRMERNLFRGMDGLVVRTDAEREYVRRTFAIPVERLHVVPDGVDVDFLACREDDEAAGALRAELVPDGSRAILFAGEFKTQSGVLDLIEGFRLLRSRAADVVLIMLGDGLLMPQARAAAASIPGSPVIFVGRQPRERLRLFQRVADAVVTPEVESLYNELAVPLKLLDCLASGKPTVATRIRSHAAIVRDGVSGILVEPQDPESMAAGLARALQPDAKPLGQRGRALVEEEWSWRSSAAAAVAMYRRVLETTAPLMVAR